MDHPIGIDQIAHQSGTGRWAGGDKPIRIYVSDQRVSVDHALPRPRSSAQGSDVLRLGLGNTNENLVSVTKRNSVEQIKAAALHAGADRASLATDFFGPCHALIVIGMLMCGKSKLSSSAPLLRRKHTPLDLRAGFQQNGRPLPYGLNLS
jgi:hypothetical protein